ncbi:MAG: response regulator transcription factor [Bacteroidetes bacterium]|nr:response regulator transcription factor [Bacteroidota bacterium]
MLKLFIVDDSKLIVDRLINLLSDVEGLRIIGHANSASVAKDYIRRSAPDFVILDIHLRDGSGIELLKDVKMNLPGTTVMMLTNFPEEDYRKKCFELGAEYFLDKSIEFEKVILICRQMAKQKELKKQKT